MWCQLKDICSFLSRGKSPIYSNTIREYPVFAQKCNLKEGGISLDKALFLDPITLPRWPEQYKLQNEDILVNSTGTGTVGRTRLFSSNCLGNYPFVVPDSHVSVIRTWENISSKYVLAVLSSEYGQHYIEDNLAGSTNQKELYIGVLEEFPIPIAPSNEQQLIAEKIDSLFDAIFQIDRTKENLEADISAAKSMILDLAIHGKLVPQDHNDEPAIELLRRINPDFTPSDNLHYQGKLPNGWTCATFDDIFDTIPAKPHQVLMSEIKRSGTYPVISQGANYIDGYSDCVEKHLAVTNPIIIFGDHSKVLKYVDFDFIVGADGVKILVPRVLPKYAYYHLQQVVSQMDNRGYSRNFQYLSSNSFFVPPFKEQKRIVSAIEQILTTLSAITK